MKQVFADGTYIADTSAWAHARAASVRREWSAALRNGQIATCPVIALELLVSARDREEFDEIAGDLAQLRDVPVTRSVTNVAQQAFRELAHVRPLHHRSVKIPDLLIAACASGAAVGVLHYDEDFDRLANVLPFDSRWIAPRGSL